MFAPRIERVRGRKKIMTCLNPKPVKFEYFDKIDETTGEVRLSKHPKFNIDIDELTTDTDLIPCGKCEGCLIDKANDWATRAYLESQKWPYNAFLTLTYDNEHLPKHRTLVKADLQKFWKRLRKAGHKFKYLCCGEYGPTTLRPHYHAIVFGYWPDDAKFYKYNKLNDWLYTSQKLNNIWGNGFVIVGRVNYETAAYVARYVFKKSYGGQKLPIKSKKEKEFILSSKRPALTSNWQTYVELAKRNNGILVPTKSGPKIKKLPQYIAKKWRENNPNDYYHEQEIRNQMLKENYDQQLKNTTINFAWYLKKKANIKKEKLKRLDKFRNNL